jgi:hypothetical protein
VAGQMLAGHTDAGQMVHEALFADTWLANFIRGTIVYLFIYNLVVWFELL